MNKPNFSNLKAVFVNCTLKKSPETSHTDYLMDVSKQMMKKEKVTIDEMRLVVAEI